MALPLGRGSTPGSWWRRRPGWPTTSACTGSPWRWSPNVSEWRCRGLYKHVRGLDALLQKLSALATGELAVRLADAAAGKAKLDALLAIAAAYRRYAA